jgi:hypothetical protein
MANKERIFGSAPWQFSGHWLSLAAPGLEWRDGLFDNIRSVKVG